MVMRGRLLVPSVIIAGCLAVIASVLILHPDVLASSFPYSMEDGANAAKGTDQASDLFGPTGMFKTITNVLLFIVGAVSVIMLIIGGIRYVVSGGDSTAVQNAKNTILYAVVGIVICLLAYAVVSFVIGSFTGNPTGGAGATNT